MALKFKREKISSHKLNSTALSVFLSIARIAFLLIVGNIVLYPMIYMISYSLKDLDALLDIQHMWFPLKSSFQNYVDMFELMNFGSSLLQTLKVQILSAFIEVFVCAFIAYGFARFNFKGKKIATLFLILSLLIPIQMYSLPMSINFKNLNIFNTPFVYWLPSLFGVGIRSGMMIFIYQQFFIGLPKELEEAAEIDGCSVIQKFFVIVDDIGIVHISAIVFTAFYYLAEVIKLCRIKYSGGL